MKTIKFMMAMLAFVCLSALPSCGNDDDDENGGGSDSSIVGTWEMVSMDPEDDDYVQEITFKKDGKVYGTFIDNGYETSHFTGTYTLKGDKLKVYVSWVGESDSDEDETWNLTILDISKNTIDLLLNIDHYSCRMKFKRVSDSGNNDEDEDYINDKDYASQIIGFWNFVSIHPYDNEYVYEILFSKNGKVEGKFNESDGELSCFEGTYKVTGNKITCYVVFSDEYGEESETWEVTIVSINQKRVILKMGKYEMEFERM